MLTALKEHLERLVGDPRDPFARRLREQLGHQEGPAAAEPLRQMILSVPQIIAAARLWLEDPDIGGEQRRLCSFSLTYLFHPRDFMAEREYDLYGYLDDAYLACAVFLLVWPEIPPRRRQSPDLEALVARIPEWMRLARRVIPQEAAEIEDLLRRVGAEDYLWTVQARPMRGSR